MHTTRHPQSRPLVLATFAVLSTFVAPGCSKAARTTRILEQANVHLAAGELEKAEIEFKNALQKDGQNAEAISRLGLLYHEQGRDSRAAAFLLRARELQPENLAIRYRLGLAHLSAGGAKQAREEALFILERRPDDAEAPLLLVEASVTPSELEETRQRLLALKPTSAKSPAGLVALGNIALRQNRSKEAEESFQAAIAIDPKFAAAYGSLGLLHWSKKDAAAADAAFKQAFDLSPDRSPRRLHYAQFKLQSGDVAEARQILEAMGRKTPDYLPIWSTLAEIALNERKLDEAEGFVAKSLAHESQHAETLLVSARIRLAKGEAAKAVEELDRLATMFPRSPQVSYQLGLAYAANGDTNKALTRIGQVVAAAPELPQAAITLAELYLRKRDFSAAIATLRSLVQQRPDMIGARVLFAEAHRGQGNIDEAAAVYAELQKQLPRDPHIAFARATILLQQKNPTAARVELLRVRELHPGHFPALEQLVDLDLRDKQPTAARQRIEAELAKNPQAAQLQLLLARVSATQSDAEGTEASLKKALELQPTSMVAHYQLAQFYVRTGQEEKAIANLQETTRNDPKSSSAHLLLGILLDHCKDHAAARDAYEKALALEPKSGLALNNLAYLYSERLDQLDKALEMAQRARAILPQDPRTADTLGWILTKKKQYAHALPLLQESAGKLPSEPEVQYHLGATQYALADEAAALAALQRAVDSGARFPGLDDARERISLLRLDPNTIDVGSRSLLDKRLAAQPDDPVAHLRLGSLARRSGEIDQALAHYKSVLQANPRHPLALIDTARIYAAKKELPKALEAAKAARSAASSDPAITHAVGRIAYEAGDHRWAASLLQELARTQPDNPEILIDWAESAYSVGRIADAESSLRRALENRSTLGRAAEAERFLSVLTLASEPTRIAAAKSQIEEALKSDSTHGPALMAAALLAEQSANPAAARTAYEKLLARFPEFSPAQRNLVLLYAADPAATGKATALASKARQAFPNDPALARAIGIVAYRQSDYSKAANVLQDFATKNERDSEVLYYLGMAQYHLNKRNESKKSLQRALDLGLQETLAVDARKRIAVTE